MFSLFLIYVFMLHEPLQSQGPGLIISLQPIAKCQRATQSGVAQGSEGVFWRLAETLTPHFLPSCRPPGHPLGRLAPRGQAVHLQSLRRNSDHMEREGPRQAGTDNHPTW